MVPLILGNSARRHFKQFLENSNIPYGVIGNLVLLLIIYTTFCDTFGNDSFELDRLSLLQIAATVIMLQLLLLAISFYISTHSYFGKRIGFQAADTVAILFCSTHKSLTLGVPMLNIIYHQDSSLPLFSVPLLIYHPTQILLGGFIAPYAKKWLHREKKLELNQEADSEISA